MIDEEKRIDDWIDTLLVARTTAVHTAQESNEFASNAEIADIANGLLEKLKTEAKQALLEMIREARLETSISIVKAEHELLFNKLPVGDVDAWQMLMMLKSHLTMLSERIRADEGALAQLSNNNNTEEGK